MTAPSADQASEQEVGWLTALAAGDLRALEPLYIRHRALVMTVLRRHGAAQPDELEDLCQEVFLALRDSARHFRRTSTVRAFIAGIAVRKSWKLRFRAGLHRRLLARFLPDEEETRNPQAAVDAARETQRLLSQLPDVYRTVLVLHHVEELSTEEIAAALGISVKTVWTRLHRARHKLRELEELA